MISVGVLKLFCPVYPLLAYCVIFNVSGLLACLDFCMFKVRHL